MKRPMLYWVCLFVLGEIISLQFSMDTIGFCMFGMLGVLSGVSHFFRKKWTGMEKYMIYLGGVFFLLGILGMYRLSKDVSVLQSFCGQDVQFEGMVYEIQKSETSVHYVIRLTNIYKIDYGQDCTEKYCYQIHRNVQVSLKENYSLAPGDVVAGYGEGCAFKRATNPGGFDEKQYRFSNGQFLSVSDVKLTKVKKMNFSIVKYLYRIRERFSDIYNNLLQPKDAALAQAMVLGDKANLDQDVKQMYQKNGIAHLIAISGLHIAMIGGSVYQLLRKLLGGFLLPVCAGITFIVSYGVMTGLSSATLRAVIMLVMTLLGDLLGRRYDALTAVAVALFFMLFKNPYQITQVGFLLSFGAILGIELIVPVFKNLLSHVPKWCEGFLVSISVQMIINPIMLYFFYEIPVYSIFLNSIVVPLMSVLLAFLMIGGAVSQLWLPVGQVCMFPAEIIFRIYEWLCDMNQNIPGNTFCMGRPEIWWMVLYYGGLAFWLWCCKRGKSKKSDIQTKVCYIAMVILMGILASPVFLKDSFMVCMFDVGQGDGIYMRTPHHKHILIDGGSSTKKKLGDYVLTPGLKYYGCHTLDYVFLTHMDSDHYSGVKEMLDSETIYIRNLILPGIMNPDDTYFQIEQMARDKGCNIIYMIENDRLVLDGICFSCLNPQPVAYEDKNTGSLVLMLQYLDFEMLLTGDMDEKVERRLLEEGELGSQIDVLKVSHHGSGTASTNELLNIIRPKVACISVGENNRYGHPSAEVIERLRLYSSKMYLTKEDGAITINTDGNRIWIEEYIRSRYEEDK